MLITTAEKIAEYLGCTKKTIVYKWQFFEMPIQFRKLDRWRKPVMCAEQEDLSRWLRRNRMLMRSILDPKPLKKNFHDRVLGVSGNFISEKKLDKFPPQSPQ